MNIAGVSTASLSPAMVMDEISTKVLKMNMDLVDTMGDGMQKIIDASAITGVGGNFDVSV